jgi:hypothetical protein
MIACVRGSCVEVTRMVMVGVEVVRAEMLVGVVVGVVVGLVGVPDAGGAIVDGGDRS